MPDVRRQGFGEVSPGDHLIFIYEDPAELTAFAVPFINGGLAGGERCLYVVDDPELPEITEALAAGGVNGPPGPGLSRPPACINGIDSTRRFSCSWFAATRKLSPATTCT